MNPENPSDIENSPDQESPQNVLPELSPQNLKTTRERNWPMLDDNIGKLEPKEKQECIQEAKEWIKSVINNWYNGAKPDYVFLGETSAIPVGYVLKEAWKTVYGSKKVPKFYRMDPEVHLTPDNEKKYFDKRIKKTNANIMVFDEGYIERETYGPYLESRRGKKEPFSSFAGHSTYARMAYRVYKGTQTRKPNIYTCHGMTERAWRVIVGNRHWHEFTKNPTSKIHKSFVSNRAPTEDERMVDQDYAREWSERSEIMAGRVVKHPEQRKRALAYIKELKELAREAGEELQAEFKKGTKRDDKQYIIE
jgi:hypothetical protein